MKIQTIPVAKATATEMQKAAAQIPATADFCAIHYNCEWKHEGTASLGRFHGASSCLGVMSNSGETEAAIFAIEDPEGDYGTGIREIESDAQKAAVDATNAALAAAERPGEAPDLVWVSATPGSEEAVLAGIQSVVGSDVPVIGGSAADNSVEGNWSVTDGEQSFQNGVIVSVLFPSTPFSHAYQSGYAPTANSGVVTAVDGRRLISIDNRPAAEVYAEWNNGAIRANGKSHNILAEATLWPLGREQGSMGDVPMYLLAHPSAVHPDKSLDLFAELEEGERITQMTGQTRHLAERAGRVAGFAAETMPKDNPLAGALVVYCGGCMLAVRDHMDTVVNGIDAALDGAPFLGVFTFGEQGPIHGSGNRHGNLMISCIAFSEET